tara:strand:- start:8854 stop:9147 length:294 start_codon:yes stop_codon:yes gene_type:complete
MAPKKKPYSKLSKTAKFYRNNPDARKKKAATDKKVNSRSEQKKKRRESGRKRTAAKRAGKNIEGKDYDHKQKKFISSKANRGQKEKSRVKGSKRKKK